jgi:hypothetical protein
MALSLMLLAPYIAAGPSATCSPAPPPSELGRRIGLAAAAMLMPLFGRRKKRLGRQLGSQATTGGGTQNIFAPTCPWQC